MNMFYLTMNKDYFVPLTKKEMIEKLEHYKDFVITLYKGTDINNKEYYELLESLINLEISAFDLKFPNHFMIPGILKDTMMYNVWNKTLNVVNKFNNRDIILIKEPEKHGFVKVYGSVVSDINLKPPYTFTKPSISINAYESDYETVRMKMEELRNKYDKLKSEQREFRLEEMFSSCARDAIEDDSEHISEDDEDELYTEYSNSKSEKEIERYFGLSEELEETRKLMNMYRKSLCMYKNGIYKEVAHALLEEYHIYHEEGKDLVKSLPWIIIRKKSL